LVLLALAFGMAGGLMGARLWPGESLRTVATVENAGSIELRSRGGESLLRLGTGETGRTVQIPNPAGGDGIDLHAGIASAVLVHQEDGTSVAELVAMARAGSQPGGGRLRLKGSKPGERVVVGAQGGDPWVEIADQAGTVRFRIRDDAGETRVQVFDARGQLTAQIP
jgi:hypothetical protein